MNFIFLACNSIPIFSLYFFTYFHLLQIYSTSRDGTIGLWDLQSGTRVQSWDVIDQPIESIVIVGSSHTTAILTCSWREAQAGRALAFDLSKGAALESRIKLSKPRPLTLSVSGNLIATHDRHTILVWAPDSFGSSPPLALHHTKAITCVAISPDGAKLAAGDNTGRIIIWHDVAATLAARTLELQQQQAAGTIATGNFDSDDEEEAMDLIEPPAATVHWHAHAVGALVFSTDGAYLLSGGREAVLVIWDVVSGRRAYLPRLGGDIIGICVCPSDPSRYAIRQADNTLRIINAAAMTVETSLHGLRPLPRAYLDNTAGGLGRNGSKGSGNNGANTTIRGSSTPGIATPTPTPGVPSSLLSSSPAAVAPSSISNQKQMLLPPPLVIQPGTGLAVIAGPHAVLQWYDFLRDCHVDKLQLSQRNIVSLTEGDAAAMSGVYGAPTEPAATEVVFSSSGATMATVESRPDPVGGGAVQYSLKFWDRVNPSHARYGSPYRLNTLADQPHR
jgi:WD40 repeat protein